MYVWEQLDWPVFSWDEHALSKLLSAVSRENGRLLGRMQALGFDPRAEAHLHTLVEDVLQSSAIEGETLERGQVRSSIARHLGMDVGGLVPADRNVDGIVEMTLDATGNFAQPLTADRLFAWHASLFPTGRDGMRPITVGRWRDDRAGAMQVISGPLGREKVYYEAPPAERLPREMARFLDWFATPHATDPFLTAGLAHFWFVTLHPFDDGNGRIARAITDMALARSEASSRRFYSMSAQIRREREDYYAILESSQKGGMDVTRWQNWFLNCLLRAIDGAEDTLGAVLRKARFWQRFAKEPMNERQIAVLNQLLEGFEGKLTTSKWAKLAKCSQDTAYRDVLDLVQRGALTKDAAAGRSTSYSIVTGAPAGDE